MCIVSDDSKPVRSTHHDVRPQFPHANQILRGKRHLLTVYLLFVLDRWMIAMFGSALPTLIVFPEERPVFVREYSTNHYSVLSYFVSRLALEAFLTAIQILLLSLFTKFLIEFQQEFYWMYLTLFTLAMSSTAIAMVIGSSVDDPQVR